MTSKYLKIKIVVLLLLGFSILDSVIAENVDSDYLSRLYTNPTGRIPASGVVNGAFGGAFASQGGREFSGLATAALGGVLEFGFYSSHIITNILDDATPASMIILKFSVFQPKLESRLPHAMVALCSNNWTRIKGSGGDLTGPASINISIEGVELNAHLTSLYLSLTSVLSPFYSVHGGVVLHDLRTKDLNYVGATGEPGNMKETAVEVFGGVEHKMNETTHSIFEFGSKPKIKFSQDMHKLSVQYIWQIIAGMRFFFVRYTALDVGVRYRDDYSGLADTEIMLGLNLGIDVMEKIRKSRKRDK